MFDKVTFHFSKNIYIIDVKCIENSLVIFTDLTCCLTHRPTIFAVIENRMKILIPKTENISQCCHDTKHVSWNKRGKLSHTK